MSVTPLGKLGYRPQGRPRALGYTGADASSNRAPHTTLPLVFAGWHTGRRRLWRPAGSHVPGDWPHWEYGGSHRRPDHHGPDRRHGGFPVTYPVGPCHPASPVSGDLRCEVARLRDDNHGRQSAVARLAGARPDVARRSAAPLTRAPVGCLLLRGRLRIPLRVSGQSDGGATQSRSCRTRALSQASP